MKKHRQKERGIVMFLRLCWFGLLLAAAGCATRQDIDIARYMREFEEEQAAAAAERGPDAPESPVAGLPALSEVSPASDAADEGIGGELTIQPDALLMVRVQEDSQLNGTYAVNSMGAIDLGYVGPVFLFNKNEREAERKIADVLKLRHFNKATVSVRMLRPSFDQVRVTGDVNNPGIIKIGPSDSITLRDLLLRAGGVEGSAKRARVKVIRDGLLSPVAYSLEGEDYRLVAEDGSPFIPEVFLRNNDLVHVSTAPAAARKASPGVSPKTVLVLGEVKKRGFVRFGPGEPATMLRLLFKQGGLPPYAKAKAVRVIRRHDDGFEEEFVVNAREILEEGDPDDDFALEDGDRVIVPARRISLF